MRKIIAFLVGTGLAFSQVNNASLSGEIQDASQAAVGAAKVSVVLKTTGASHTVMADRNGSYFFPSLAVGDYDVSVEAKGFSKATASVTLETGQKARQDFTLSVGQIESSVTVQSTVTQLSPQDASLGSVVDGNYVSRFPLLLRSWDDLLAVVPGVQGNRFTNQGGGTSFNRTGGFNVHGVRSYAEQLHARRNRQQLDFRKRAGVDHAGGTSVHRYDSGIQGDHQSVRRGVRPQSRARRSTSPPKAGPTPFTAWLTSTCGIACSTPTITSPTGRVWRSRRTFRTSSAAISARPIIKNKLFAFFDYEGTRIRKGVSRLTTVPLDNERVGDLQPSRRVGRGESQLSNNIRPHDRTALCR